MLVNQDNFKVQYTSYKKVQCPRIFVKYYEPIINTDTDVEIKFYVSGFDQLNYRTNIHYSKFTIYVYKDDELYTTIENLGVGHHRVGLGKFDTEGLHYFALQAKDDFGNISELDENDFLVENYVKNYYNASKRDLINNGIIDDYKEISDEEITNNRYNMTMFFKKIAEQGYNGVNMPKGKYRINKTYETKKSVWDYYNKETPGPITLPANFTVNFNYSTLLMEPYDDDEVIKKFNLTAAPSNSTITLSNFNSHVKNLIIDGSWKETWEKYGYSNNSLGRPRGEQNHGIETSAHFCSFENVTVQNIVGFVHCHGYINFSPTGYIGPWIDNIRIDRETGEEIEDDNYTSSDFGKIPDKIYKETIPGYITFGRMPRGNGIIGNSNWDIDMSFYDKDKKFIKQVKKLQQKRCKVPKDAIYIRITMSGTKENIDSIAELAKIFNFFCICYSALKNCIFKDNRTCIAPGGVHHYTVKDCTFGRMGYSITPYVFDFEEGGHMTQNLYLLNNVHAEGSNTCFYIIQGYDYEIFNNINTKIGMRSSVHSALVHDNSNISIDLGATESHSIVAYNNKDVTINASGYCPVNDNNLSGITRKDNDLYYNSTVKLYHSVSGDTDIGGSYFNCKLIFTQATIRRNLNVYDCVIQPTETENKATILSTIIGNEALNIVFKRSIFLYDFIEKFKAKGNKVNQLFEYCTFKRKYTQAHIDNTNAIKFEDGYTTVFNNCVFEDEVTLKNGFPVIFNNCVFNKAINYINTAKDFTTLNNCTIKEGD